MEMNVALLLIRVIVGVLLAGHGAQKLFGWFGGYGLVGTGGFFESIGYKPGKLMAFLGGLGEAGGGLLLALGLFTPLAAAAAIAVMLNAIVSVHWGKGAWATNGGWELPLAYASVAAAAACAGPGRYSLDRALGWTLSGTDWGTAAVVAAAIAAAVTLGVRAAARRSAAPSRQAA